MNDGDHKFTQPEIEKLNKANIEYIMSNIHRDEFIAFYQTHSRKDTLAQYGIRNEKVLVKILTLWNYDFSFKKSLNKGKPASRSHDSYIAAGKKSAATQRQHWCEKSDEEKKAWSEKQSLAHLNSPDFKQKITESNRQYRLSLTPEERQNMDKQRSETLHKRWMELSKEEQQAEMSNRFRNGASYNSKDSQPNLNFKRLLEEQGLQEGTDFLREFCLDRKLFDFKINNTLVEINPTFTHNSTYPAFSYNSPLPKDYHAEKSLIAKKYDYRCIHVFDWEDPRKVVELVLNNRTNLYARECDVREVSKIDAQQFINENHIQQYARDQIRLGLYYNDILVSIMTFGKPRYNHNYEYEIVRYCASANIIGGAEKLLKRFKDTYTPSSIISYCDLSKFSGRTYEKLGFSKLRETGPTRHWYNIKTGQHITDALLRQQGFSRLVNKQDASIENLPTNNNHDLMLLAGFVEIYDCGQGVYVWRQKED